MDGLEALLDFAEGVARKAFNELGEVPPLIVCERGDGERLILGYLSAPSAAHRRLVAIRVGEQLREQEIVRYCAVHEFWVAAAPGPGETPLLPSQCPDRREAVVLEAYDRADNVALRAFEIERSGGPPQLVEADIFRGNRPAPGGTWDGLLHDSGMMH